MNPPVLGLEDGTPAHRENGGMVVELQKHRPTCKREVTAALPSPLGQDLIQYPGISNRRLQSSQVSPNNKERAD